MDMLLSFITWLYLIAFFGAVFRLAKRIAAPALSEWLISSHIVFVAAVIPSGFVLSGLHLTASPVAWMVATTVALGLLYVVSTRLSPSSTSYSIRQLLSERLVELNGWYKSLSPYLKVIFGLMIGTLTIIGVTNLLLVLFTVPNEWDSMTGHLNRAVRYIQHGTMAHFGGTNWNMDTYPKSVTAIQIFTYLMSGKIENAFKYIHHASYWIGIVALYGTVQRITRNRTASIFTALAFGMFLNYLMQAVTTETDNVLTAYLSCLIYFLYSYHATRQDRYLYLSGLTFAIAFGHKITFALLLPSVFMVMVYTVFWAPDFKTFGQRTLKLGLAIGLSVLVYTLPTGYIRNIQVFGHPIGPPTALKHQSVERAGTVKNLLKQGTRNTVRYAYDFANLDGLRNVQWGYDLNKTIRKPLVWLEDKLKLRLDEETDFSIVPFQFQRRFEFYNANPYWGVWGFALILPFILLVLTKVINSRLHVFLAVAFVLHYIAISYSAAYDPWKGRYFQESGVFGALFLMLLFTNHRLSILKTKRFLWKSYVLLITATACVSAILAVFLNIRCLPFPAYGYESAFVAERIPFQTFARPDITPAYVKFDSLVPADAVVALGTINDDFEYPLYGEKLTRRLISINPFEQGVQPIPKEADYLFFAKSVIEPLPTDLRMDADTSLTNLIVKGEDYYLRKLK
jgi:hypothetical protein